MKQLGTYNIAVQAMKTFSGRLSGFPHQITLEWLLQYNLKINTQQIVTATLGRLESAQR